MQRSAVAADAIVRRRADIEERWLAQVRADARAAHVELSALKDGIGSYLERIAAELRGLAGRSEEGWRDIAHEHALTRVRLGFDVEQLMHELVILRKTVNGVLREEAGLPVGQSLEQVDDIVDVATAASVKSYVQARDYELRREQAKNVGFLVHQVRSPLTAVVLALSEIRRKVGDTSGVGRALDRAERSLQRIGALVSEALELERLDAGATRAEPVETTLGQVLQDVIEGSRQAAERKGIGFDAEYDADRALVTDPKLLLTAIEHLLENAIKYTDAGEVSFAVTETPGQLEFHVRDTGPGMSEEELKVAFEPFRRGSSGKSGTGLGLTIVKKAVSALGGEVYGESSGDRGCHFWFVLPSARH